jgi:pilus assembly protein TadC
MNLSEISLGLLAVALLMLPGGVAGGRRLRVLCGGERMAPGARSRAQTPDQLAVASALDLLAACLRAGLPVAAAVRAVAPTAPEPLCLTLRRAADLLALGADPIDAWQRAVGDTPLPELQALARLVRRSARSGSALADAVTELAAKSRAALEDAALARAERAGVLLGGPLGLCFLPAFVCLGIVPVVVGLAGRVLNGGLL